jgi:cobalamin biosynthesis protein CobD/CbiB
MWRTDPFQILIALALDLLLGDPRGWPHIARMAGSLSIVYEKLLVARLRRSVLLGVIFWTLVAGTMLALYAAAHRICWALSPLAARALETLVIYQAIAAMDLSRHARAIIEPLRNSDLGIARSRLARIVGRDTESLDESEISRAAIESVAGFCVFNSAVHWKTIRREAAAHASPNAGWSEAAMAHALGVRLGGDNFYDGQCVAGPVFNASSRTANAADIAASLTWMWRVAGTCASGFVALLFALKFLSVK